MILTRRLPGYAFEVQPPQLADTLPRMDIAVIVGFAASGPLDTPVLVEDEAHFVEIFGPDLYLVRRAEGDVDRQSIAAASGQNDEKNGVFAYLAPAVRAFFRGGGRRCWIVRVARNPNLAYLPVPGLVGFAIDRNELTPAFAPARSEGTWAESLQTSSALLSLPLMVKGLDLSQGRIHLHLERQADLAPGDLIHLNLADGDWHGYIFAGSIAESRLAGAVPGDVLVQIAEVELAERKSPAVFWFQPAWVQKPISERAVVTKFISHNTSVEIQAFLPSGEETLGWPTTSDGPVHLNLELNGEKAPAVGEMVIVEFDAQTFWMSVETVSEVETDEELSAESLPVLQSDIVQISGSGFWQKYLPGGETLSPPELVEIDGIAAWNLVAAEKLTFELTVRDQVRVSSETQVQGNGGYAANMISSRLSDLSFAPIHTRFWGSLPNDIDLFTMAEAGISPGHEVSPSEKYTIKGSSWAFQPGRSGNLPQFWTEAANPRFPLAGRVDDSPYLNGGKPGWYLPLFVSNSRPKMSCPPQTGDKLERDGLAEFDAGLFLDPQLIDTNLETLADRAEYLRFLSPKQRKLKGIHAAMAIEEATLVIVPDAIHTGWMKSPLEKPPDPRFDPRRPHPDWWKFTTCQEKGNDLLPCEPSDPALVDEPAWGNFLARGLRIIESPELWIVTQDGRTAKVSLCPTGTYSVQWTAREAEQVADELAPEWQLENPNYLYILEEASLPDFSDAVVVYQGDDHSANFFGRSQGLYYYRVRISVFDYSGLAPEQFPQHHYESDWSNGAGVQSKPQADWIANPPFASDDLFSSNLQAIHWGLLRMCAARGDMFAFLAVPQTWREESLLRYIEVLQSGMSTGVPVPAADLLSPGIPSPSKMIIMPSLDAGETRAWSFGALYHPWLIGYEPEPNPNNSTGSTSLQLRAVPPDGAVCGLAAGRAFSRGAWIAPANQPIGGVVHLTPILPATRRLELQNAQINLVRQEPDGFLILNADTLSRDPDLRQITVRRLICLLRRIALRVGPMYVFEPNTSAFERMVQRSIETVMTGLFSRGAFAGRKPEESFQVTVKVSHQDREEGRFIIEIKFAPSQPLTFITIRLVQSGERSVITE